MDNRVKATLWDFQRRQQILHNKKLYELRNKNIKKINKLEKKEYENHKIQESSLKNLTDKELPVEVYQISVSGPKFSINITSSEQDMLKSLADIENIIQEKQDLIRTKVTRISTNYVHNDRDLRRK